MVFQPEFGQFRPQRADVQHELQSGLLVLDDRRRDGVLRRDLGILGFDQIADFRAPGFQE
jgi:hypothetical protein